MNPIMYVYEQHQEPIRQYAARCIILEDPEFAISVLREAGLLEEVEIVRCRLVEKKTDRKKT